MKLVRSSFVVLGGALFLGLPITSLAGAEQDPGKVMVACISRVNSYYSGAPQDQDYLAFVPVAKVKPFVPKDMDVAHFVEENFSSWVYVTKEYGRWNSLTGASIDCDLNDADIEHRMMTATNAEKNYARLPSDWYKRNAAKASHAELARFSNGAAAPGSELKDGAALTIKGPDDVLKGWTPEQISRAREAAAEQAKKLADAKRNDASAQAKIRKFFEDMKKRGSAQ